jgi:nicotinate-nucleotide pyrophosphorylase (carboxylating)
VEARDEVKEIVACEGVYRILLDNFDYEMTRKAVLLLGINGTREILMKKQLELMRNVGELHIFGCINTFCV